MLLLGGGVVGITAYVLRESEAKPQQTTAETTVPPSPSDAPLRPLPGPPPGKAKEAASPARPLLPQPVKPRRDPWLDPAEQRNVDEAVKRGLDFLRERQHSDGSWGHQQGGNDPLHTPGITALAALTMLECGVPSTNQHIQLAADYLRKQMPSNTTTYSISLAMLFFDRLGDPQDIPHIRSLALRLLAGQKPSGGWDYRCPLLKGDEELGLLTLLYQDRPTTAPELFATTGETTGDLVGSSRPPSSKLGLYRPEPSIKPPLALFATTDSAGKEARPTSPPRGGAAIPGDTRRLSPKALDAAGRLPRNLRQTPALHSKTLLSGRPNDLSPRTDNSNTQFAILGLLAAERYDVPMERAMALIDWRFRHSQVAPGRWQYQSNMGTSPAMTGAALLGLALKHGLVMANAGQRGRNVILRDTLINRGIGVWSNDLDDYFKSFLRKQEPLQRLDIYVLWTVERVAALYDLRRFGKLDWYVIGVRLLLPLQARDGSWSPAAMRALNEPAVSTAFALLFLERSNLARDLTQRLNKLAAPPK